MTISFYLTAAVCNQKVRGGVIRWLGSLSQSAGKEQEAASVAALIEVSAADALTSAANLFRAPLTARTREELANNRRIPRCTARRSNRSWASAMPLSRTER